MRPILLITLGFVFFFGCSPETKEPKRPNILFAISDDQSFPHAGIYGFSSAQTPNFDRVAKEGILFTNAFSAAPGCSPSRASILTGRHIWQLEEAGTHASGFPAKYICYTDLLEEEGYLVGFTAKGWGPGNWEISGRTRNPAGNEYSDIKNESVPMHINKTEYAANFKAFLDDRTNSQPFCFWYGATEPHRRYQTGIGAENGFDPDNVNVPGFLPDVESVRSDVADYLFEINHFDKHLGKMLDLLEALGELDNTLVVVTSDNGMPFPRAKANMYEYGWHMPMAVMWADKIKGGRQADDLVSLTDLAPTFLDVAGVTHPSEQTGEYPMIGNSLMNIFKSTESGTIDVERTAVFGGRERHSSSRPHNYTYPSRAVRTSDFLYIVNFKPDRWPAGDPLKYGKDGALEPGYHDIDDFTESYIYEKRDDEEVKKYFDLAVAKRPEEELFDIQNDPACLINLADHPEFNEVLIRHRDQLMTRLKNTGDPRVTGNGDIWESYIRYSPIRSFPESDSMIIVK